jgi:hypothetical protein
MKMTGARNGKCPPGRATAGRAAFGPSRSGPQSQEEFDDDHAHGLNREVVAHLSTLDFVTGNMTPRGSRFRCRRGWWETQCGRSRR